MAELQISIKAARINANMTQTEAASAIGVSNVTISNWENGRTLPDIKTARKIAEVYGVPLDNLYLSDG